MTRDIGTPFNNTLLTNMSLLTLPVELLHRILDFSDIQTILHSFRLVCKQFDTVVNSYNRLELDFSSMSNFDAKLFSQCIQPENVTSLVFSDSNSDRSQIYWFSTYSDIRRFCRLRSLAIPQLTDVPSVLFLDCSCRYFESTSSITDWYIKQIREKLILVSSAMAQTSLQRLYLNELNYITQHIPWPVQCTLKHLTVGTCRLSDYHTILSHSPYLRTFAMKSCIMGNTYQTVLPSTTSSSYPQLEFLSITNCTMTTRESEFLLSLTPSLFHLKLISCRSKLDSMFDGSYWEQFIQNKLSCLEKFEFFFSCNLGTNNHCPIPESLIVSFQTSFWVNSKRLFVTCDYTFQWPQIAIYTIPVCKKYSKKSSGFEASSIDGICWFTRHCTNEMTHTNAENVCV